MPINPVDKKSPQVKQGSTVKFDLAKYFTDANEKDTSGKQITYKKYEDDCKKNQTYYQSIFGPSCFSRASDDLKFQSIFGKDGAELLNKDEFAKLAQRLQADLKEKHNININLVFHDAATALNSNPSFNNAQGQYNGVLVSRSELVRYLQNRFQNGKIKLPENTAFHFYDSVAKSK